VKNIFKIVFAAMLCTTFSHQAFASPNQSVLAKHLIDKQDDDFKKFIKYSKKRDTLVLESYATKGKIAALGLTGLGCSAFAACFSYLTLKYYAKHKNLPESQQCDAGKVVLEQSLYLAFIALYILIAVLSDSRTNTFFFHDSSYHNLCSNHADSENCVRASFWSGVMSLTGFSGALVSFLYAYKAYKRRTSHTPKLKLSPEGIYINGVKVACWEDINDIMPAYNSVAYYDQNARNLLNLSRNDSSIPMDNSDLILLMRHYIEKYGREKFKTVDTQQAEAQQVGVQEAAIPVNCTLL
jgi:hypothetical protein